MTSLLEDDVLAINRINPYTATETFGISTNGTYKGSLDWTYPADGPPSWQQEEKPEYVDHFGPHVGNRSGSMYLRTGDTSPSTSFMFPARKYQYDDGTTSWSRETVWKNGENYMNQNPFARKETLFPIWLLLVIVVILLAIQKS